MDLLRRKSVTDLQNEALTDHSLKRALGALNLTLLGIGAIIGTGIFVLTGTVAAVNAARGRALVHPRRDRVDLRRAVLLRVRLARPHGGERLHLRLRHAGR